MSQAVVTSVQEITKSSEEELQKLHTEIREAVVENIKETSTKLVNGIKDISKNNAEELQKLATKASDTVNSMATNTANTVDNTAKNMATTIDNMAKTFAEESVTKLQGVVGRMDKQLGEAGGYIAGALSKMGDDLYELHNKYEDQKSTIEKLQKEPKKPAKKGE